ncbi:hypothetical protein PV396_42935 [Streptomyces sp. ME02-8801-2C]|uniref:OsmC family protein n=1 Tax=Streptomyces sp. ME02-8801-2C TaxID=3028680 RepID=UPI0029BCEE3B|nr:hypothetical protein [Streptomyces sp. ME02-8801-2C]MDX3458608.1 hypothetical protein [Streptomyces sp. ME02-8801-2C]
MTGTAAETTAPRPSDAAAHVLDVIHVDGDAFAVEVRGHRLLVDQPADAGGTDTAPTPTELFAASLATCVAFYAGRYRTLTQCSILQGRGEGHPAHSGPEGRGGMAKIASSDDEVVGSTAGRAGSDACGGPCKTELSGDRQGPVKQEPKVVPRSGADRNLPPSGRRGRQLHRHGLGRAGLRVRAEFTMATDRPARVGSVRVVVSPPPGLPEERRAALLAVASHCTVHNTLHQPPAIGIELEP